MSVNELPPELEGFAFLLDSQPPPVREAFQYCLCLMMVEMGEMHLVETLPGESAPLYLFKTSAGDRFSVPRPDITSQQEGEILDALRDILQDEDLL